MVFVTGNGSPVIKASLTCKSFASSTTPSAGTRSPGRTSTGGISFLFNVKRSEQLCHRWKARIRVDGEPTEKGALDLNWYQGSRGRRQKAACEHVGAYLRYSITGEWHTAVERLVDGYTEAKLIAAAVHHSAAILLGGHIAWSTGDDIIRGDWGAQSWHGSAAFPFPGHGNSDLAVQQSCQPEVHHSGVLLSIEKNIVRFKVTMDKPRLVHSEQSGACLPVHAQDISR